VEYLAVLLPSAAVGAIFYFVMRSIFNADRSEREALAQAERDAGEGNATGPQEAQPDGESESGRTDGGTKDS
jgi:hypothetical protein